jgi:hypothetical protein
MKQRFFVNGYSNAGLFYRSLLSGACSGLRGEDKIVYTLDHAEICA